VCKSRSGEREAHSRTPTLTRYLRCRRESQGASRGEGYGWATLELSSRNGIHTV
jgi:hypothetical protein